MIVTIRIPQSLQQAAQCGDLLIRTRDNCSLTYAVDVLKITPEFELTEKEKILSELFNQPLTQSLKELLAKVVNKAYEK